MEKGRLKSFKDANSMRHLNTKSSKCVGQGNLTMHLEGEVSEYREVPALDSLLVSGLVPEDDLIVVKHPGSTVVPTFFMPAASADFLW